MGDSVGVNNSYASLPSPLNSTGYLRPVENLQPDERNDNSGEISYIQEILDNGLLGEDFRVIRSNARRQKRKVSVFPVTSDHKKGKRSKLTLASTTLFGSI